MDKARYIKLRELVRRLRKSRHAQAKQIDILCNDMVQAHGEFVRRLRALNFGVGFYEFIVGASDLHTLLNMAATCIKNHVSDSNVAIFLCEGRKVIRHILDENKPAGIDRRKLENYFTSELAHRISQAAWVCSLDDMFEMGLEGDLKVLNKISAAAVPIRRHGPGLGFVLVYRSIQNKLSPEELEGIAGVMAGFCRAIENLKPAMTTSAVS